MEEDNNLPGPSGYHNRFRNRNVKNQPELKWRKNKSNNFNNFRNKMQHVGILSSSGRFKNRLGEKVGSGQDNNKKIYHIGFKFLDQLTASNNENIIKRLEENKDGLLRLVQEPIESRDIFVQIIAVMAKLTQTSFDQMASNILIEICNSNFIGNLRNYLMDLPNQPDKEGNKLYWNDPHNFWQNFMTLFEYIIHLLPSIALNKCKPMIDITTTYCLEKLSDIHGFTLLEDNKLKFETMRERLSSYEEKKKLEVNNPKSEDTREPLESFRVLSILPTTEDFLDNRPFLRKNIIEGGYRDVEHYLDVQFRLLREDCYGPLRDGINQYMRDKNCRQFDHLRVYRSVKFLETYVNDANFKSGYIIQIDTKICKKFQTIRWAQNKRFLHGALLLLTKDNCRNFIVAIVLDRDVELLKSGKIPVSVYGNVVVSDLFKDESYVMFESEVYFEPYYHVLKVLQHPKFPEHIAMSKYIIKTEPEPKAPAYLDNQSKYSIKINNRRLRFKVLQEETWPTAAEMGLNDSQYVAYKMALTQEFTVIQGPPGTGKTFLGVNIARALLKNYSAVEEARIEALNKAELNSGDVGRPILQSSSSDAQKEIPKMTHQACIMLLVCYTNHALDQFLEAILPITNSIVRIGGQSRNETLTEYNINNVRRTSTLKYGLYSKLRYELKEKINTLRSIEKSIDLISKDIIIDYDIIKSYNPESGALDYLASLRERVELENPLTAWLFEGEHQEPTTFEEMLLHVNEYKTERLDDDFVADEDDSRKCIILDDFEHEVGITKTVLIKFAYSLSEATDYLRSLMSDYTKSNHYKRMEYENRMINVMRRIKICKEMLKYRERRTEIEVNKTNLNYMRRIDRWSLYFRWAKVVQRKYKLMIEEIQQKLGTLVKAYEEARMLQDLHLLKEKRIQVVGMTTSGAARVRKLLQELAPPIVIVEEAAEVLEAHIVTALTKNCQHLILIGDHQQLRPSASYMKLARRYNIEVSLFERMILNGMHSSRLDVQHRMRPEIAALISPHIYQHLENHPNVQTFPEVRGVTKNLFFFSHDYFEERMDENSTITNRNEADIILAFANYLMLQGYTSQHITILATYTGQMFYMRNQRKRYARLDGVKITVVDNYQGEESKIILLSLVRNNAEGKIGFLGIKNRICVALSRAREGFYMFGNIEILRKNELWNNIAVTLESNKCIGNTLTLRCENHRDQITEISSADNFKKIPEGGCLQKCNSKLPKCGHPCSILCHGYDREHERITCTFDCERKCENGHVCALKCSKECNPCPVVMEKSLPCGHFAKLKCYQKPEKYKCMIIVPSTIPKCGHMIEKACYLRIEDALCTRKCEIRVERCGHTCRRPCHVLDDPHHENYECLKRCTRAKKGCLASLDEDRGEHGCTKICRDECDPCVVKVKKRIPDCGHELQIECNIEPLRAHCKENCERVMQCGHPCKGRCASPCDSTRCEATLEETMLSSCGHSVPLLCYLATSLKEGSRNSDEVRDKLSQRCVMPCSAKLLCEHECSSTCSKCRHGALHVSCTKPCGATNVCGHICESPCNQVCPPCNKRCPVTCPHNRCGKLCGAPCVSCQEKCTRACEHSKCTKLCGAKCSRAACSERCSKRLPCGHPCRGLCGESCPDVCVVCRPDSVPKDFILQPYEDDDIFIKLEDCAHIFSVDEMDMHVKKEEHIIKIPACPLCRVPIINTYRYKDIIDDILQNEINPVKRKVYGNKKQIEEMRRNLLNKINLLKRQNLPKYLKTTFEVLAKNIIRNRRSALLQQNTYLVKIEIFEIINDLYNKYLKLNFTAFNTELSEHIKPISEILKNEQKLSEQRIKDINGELKRINALINFAGLINTETYKAIKSDPEIVKATELARNSVFKRGVFDEIESLDALCRIQDSQEYHKMERELVVKAMGTKMGHWYKCPNGHPYYIGDCGGAMQVSKCIECGVAVGGRSHRLLAGNSHAGEVDGSSFAAWSEQANNMNNFDLNYL